MPDSVPPCAQEGQEDREGLEAARRAAAWVTHRAGVLAGTGAEVDQIRPLTDIVPALRYRALQVRQMDYLPVRHRHDQV